MSAIRTCAALGLLVVAVSVWAAAPPPALPIAKWIEELGSDDEAVRDRAADNLWSAGAAAMPALVAAKKNPDPDVVLRATLILGRLEWGIRPDTPAAVVKLIEQFRDGDANQKTAAVEKLAGQGRPGYVALSRLLPRSSDEALRKQIAGRLERLTRLAVREMIARGELADAEQLLETTAEGGAAEAILDLAAFHAVRGSAAARAGELERLSDEKGALVKRAVYLYRSAGDLKAARRVAQKANDAALLAHLLDELEDFKALAKMDGPELKKAPAALAGLLHRAGDVAGFEKALKAIPEKEHEARTAVFFVNDRPRQAIEAERQWGNVHGACMLLALQGRSREALALTAPADKTEATGWLQTEQAALAHRLGETEKAKALFEQATKWIAQHALPGDKGATLNDSLLGALLTAGRRMGRADDALAEVGRILDQGKSRGAPYSLLYQLAPRDGDALQLWWTYLSRQRSEDTPATILKRLNDWFVKGKADSTFDDLIAAARRDRKFTADEQARWPLALARACAAVGKVDRAKEILKEAAAISDAAAQQLGQLHFERKQWAEAADAYETALKRDPTAVLPLYLRGVALLRAGKQKEGKTLIDRARLLPLADEASRYTLAEELTRLGLEEDAAAVRLILYRTAPFRSIYMTNVASALATRAARRGRHFEAARYYRRVFHNLAFRHGGAFTDHRANLLIPGWAHLNEARGLLGEGKLDDALKEARLLWEHLPEETGVAIELVRALEKADRKADADKLFDEVFAPLRRACEEAPKSVERHNRLAWLAARCGRKLDAAVEHAKKATELRPGAASLFDTLAESHFQRGDKEDAVAAIKQAVKLEPKRKYFALQLARIEKGDPKAELPAEER